MDPLAAPDYYPVAAGLQPESHTRHPDTDWGYGYSGSS